MSVLGSMSSRVRRHLHAIIQRSDSYSVYWCLLFSGTVLDAKDEVVSEASESITVQWSCASHF